MNPKRKIKRQKMDDTLVVGKRRSLLSKPVMTFDGMLLSAFVNKGSCIPDKLVDKKELIDDLVEEIMHQLKLGPKSAENSLFQLLNHQRRGSSSPVTEKKQKIRRPQRHSWGPDNTWSSQFVNMEMFAETYLDTIKPEVDDRNTNLRKTLSESPTRQKFVISVCDDGECAENAKRILEAEKRKKELMKMTSWVVSEGHDYVHTEQAKNPTDVEIFLDVMLSSAIPVQMSFKVNSPADICITYQFLPSFKEEYMILKISRSHCMVMRAF